MPWWRVASAASGASSRRARAVRSSPSSRGMTTWTTTSFGASAASAAVASAGASAFRQCSSPSMTTRPGPSGPRPAMRSCAPSGGALPLPRRARRSSRSSASASAAPNSRRRDEMPATRARRGGGTGPARPRRRARARGSCGRLHELRGEAAFADRRNDASTTKTTCARAAASRQLRRRGSISSRVNACLSGGDQRGRRGSSMARAGHPRRWRSRDFIEIAATPASLADSAGRG